MTVLKGSEFMSEVDHSYYKRYCGAARRFELAGGLIAAAGLLARLAAGSSMNTVGLLLVLVGLCVFALGAASLRPHNAVKSFARECIQQPSDAFAQGLLDALEATPKLALVSSSLDLVTQAVELYAQFEDSDPELARRLQQAVEHRIVRKKF